LKRIHIPKKDKSQTRPLGIPVMEDRARQAVHATALQPIAESTADGDSYGFRVKRRCADAIDQCFKILRQKSSACWILEGDIKGFFDHIAFEWMLENIPMNRKVLRAWLHSGFIDRGKWFATTLNPVLRGWANYHRHVICAESFSKLDSYVWRRLFRWGKRRHPDKSGIWIAKRYFRKQDGYQWTFTDTASGKALIHVQQAIKHQQHIKVRAEANPFDSEWEEYFRNREKLLKRQSVNGFLGKVLRRQSGTCPVCRQVLEASQEHRLHHKDGNKANNRIDNVVLLHRSCQLQPQQAAKTAA
jgi:retron-type reverse transcriptase